MDIDGDSCYHAHNAAKKFCEFFDIQQLFVNLYNDFKWTSEYREKLSEICTILSVKYTNPEQYIPHRWLSVYDVAVDTLRLLDAYTLFYFGFLSQQDRTLYFPLVLEIFRRKEIIANA